MKGLAGGTGRLVEKAGLSAAECYRYSLSLPVAAQVMGITSMEQLNQNIETVRTFQPMSASEKSSLLARVKEEASDGRHELFKSTKQFDGPHHRKQHCFELAGD
jgi:predicted aldo/keto reductase-like oxidoreductase